MSSGPKYGGRGVTVVVVVTWGNMRGKSCGLIFNSTAPLNQIEKLNSIFFVFDLNILNDVELRNE
jgi:hypothetical protein